MTKDQEAEQKGRLEQQQKEQRELEKAHEVERKKRQQERLKLDRQQEVERIKRQK